MKNNIYIITILIIATISINAQTHKIAAYVIGGGGATVQSTTHKAMGTIGQPAIGVYSNASNTAKSGFWYLIPSEVLQQIALLSGWNLISTYVQPENTTLEEIFSEIEGSTVIMKNNSGQIYYPEFDINDIGDWDVKQGYQVYMSQAETLTISGMKIIPETTEIALATGWNMLAYLRDNTMDIEIALAPLVADDKLVIAKDNMGNVFYPAFEINMIGDMLPGQGYQIYMISGGTLVYPEN